MYHFLWVFFERMHAVVAAGMQAMVGLSLTAVDTCPERMDAVDAEGSRPPRIAAGMALEVVLALEAVVDAL